MKAPAPSRPRESTWLVLDRKKTPGVEKLGLKLAELAFAGYRLFSFGRRALGPGSIGDLRANLSVSTDDVLALLHQAEAQKDKKLVPILKQAKASDSLSVNITRFTQPNHLHKDLELKANDWEVMLTMPNEPYDRLIVLPLTTSEIAGTITDTENTLAHNLFLWLNGQITDHNIPLGFQVGRRI